MAERLKTEAVVAAALLSFGVLLMPFAIYFVGRQLVGEYAPGAGPLTLAEDVWIALGNGEIAAWILVLAPYVVVQLVRLTRRVLRGRSTVSAVTDPHTGR